jgi:hypothetical protein
MKTTVLIFSLMLTSSIAWSQETPLEISGSVDAYYKYDFAKVANIPTSFGTDQNSVSLGMIDLILKKKTGKTSFVAEVSFGPRGEKQSIPDVKGQSFHIQNLYATYAVSDKLNLTAGYMSTFIGYEVISPLSNLNYSTSYLFTNGPFQNGGIKANYTFSSKIGLMAGLFNDQWNVYQANPTFGLNAFGAQLTITPVKGFTAYLNLLTGSVSGTIVDLTAAYQITDEFKLGVNFANLKGVATDTGYTGLALYPSYSVTKSFILALRAESFKFKENSGDLSVASFTLSANLKSGGLTLIPEIRLDNNDKEEFFVTSNGSPTKSASQVSLAMIYGF